MGHTLFPNDILKLAISPYNYSFIKDEENTYSPMQQKQINFRHETGDIITQFTPFLQHVYHNVILH